MNVPFQKIFCVKRKMNMEERKVKTNDIYEKLSANISKVISGKNDVIRKVIITMLCGGHVLLEDMPGTGKTTLAKSLALSCDGDFRRVQFTPDLLPSEVTGLRYFNQKEGEFVFGKGAVFTNILLADEINRATPRTQSSLLECMEERQVSESGTTYKLDRPFMVIATQNPVETQGTFPLPEAQLDRFFMKLSMGYPSFDSEIEMLKNHGYSNPVSELTPVVTRDEIIAAQDEIRMVKVSDDIMKYIMTIVKATRENDSVKAGVSPRGALALLSAVKGWAAAAGRDYAEPDDVKAVAEDVLSHRLIMKRLSADRNESARMVIRAVLSNTEVPSEQEI